MQLDFAGREGMLFVAGIKEHLSSPAAAGSEECNATWKSHFKGAS
jgi:hypothetical protein